MAGGPPGAMLAPMGTIGIMRVGPPGGVPPARPLSMGQAVGGVLVLSSLFWPRLFILGFWIFDDQLGRAFSSWVIPALGFLIAPWTTVAYAFMWGMSSDRVAGVEWLVVGAAVVADLLTWWGGRRLLRS
jgi:hypothetical protein